MVQQPQLALSCEDSPGAWDPVAERIGPADGLFALTSVAALLHLGPARDLRYFRALLQGYQARILVPLELPAIHAAHSHAVLNQARELIALDKLINAGAELGGLADASRRAGRNQLLRLRPLTDQRLVRRYRLAVCAGPAPSSRTMEYSP